ncbi:MAG TPA: ATP synthase subunit I [Microthrixaceae bacterium]|nr:ATP synthase subunit I [Microthrixaceae bacterium]
MSSPAMTDPMAVRIEGPSPAMAVALDLVKRSVWLMPVIVVISAAFWGLDGVASTMYAVAIVLVNFLMAAYLLAVTGRISAALMGGAALFGFLIRLALIFLAVMLVRDAGWMELVPFAVTLIVTHLALLFWEMRYVSSSLAFPGLKPQQTPNPYLPSSDDKDATTVPSSVPNSPNAQ